MVDNDDERLGRDDDVVGQRGSRRSQDRQVAENRVLSDEDRLDEYRKKRFNDVLPDLPEIPGYHLCWLSTTHPSDTIRRRLGQGYELLRDDEVPGFEHGSMKTGEYAGCIGVNEMVAAKIKTSLYLGYMQIEHHEKPASDEEQLSRMVETIREQAEGLGAKVIEGDGMTDLHRPAPSRGIFT